LSPGEERDAHADRREPRQEDAEANELVLCMGVNQVRTPNIAMIAAGVDAAGMDPIIARARERGRYPHDFVSVSDHLGSIRRVGLQNN
jgi:hypothetical protein